MLILSKVVLRNMWLQALEKYFFVCSHTIFHYCNMSKHGFNIIKISNVVKFMK
jgi:hypothetical protein